MILEIANALLLDVTDESFKNQKGEEVEWRKARILDDNNEYHTVSVSPELEFDDQEDIFRISGVATLEIQEQNRNGNTILKKRLVNFV